VHGELGNALRVTGQLREARLELERAVELGSDDAWTWANKGAAELDDSAWTKATKSLERSIELNPDFGWAVGLRG